MKRVRTVAAISLLALLWVPQVRASLSETEANERLGKTWLGALFECDPYCRLLTVKTSKGWQPPIEGVKADWTNVRAISSASPEYPLLIPLALRSESSATLSSTAEESDLTPPETALKKKGMNWISWYLLGPQLRSMKLTSNSELQTDFDTDSPVIAANFRAYWRRIDTMSIAGVRFKPLFSAEYARSISYKSKNAAKQPNWQSFELSFVPAIKWDRARIGPYIGFAQDQMSINEDSLTGFSVTNSQALLGVFAHYDGFQGRLATSVYSQFKDAQGFRSGDLKHELVKFNLNACALETRTFGFVFHLCGEYQYELDKQTSSAAPNLLTASNLSIERQSHGLLLYLRLGEDLWFD